MPSEGDKAIRALRMMLRQTAACELKRMGQARGACPTLGACDKCVERDYQAALELAARELEKEPRSCHGCGSTDVEPGMRRCSFCRTGQQ